MAIETDDGEGWSVQDSVIYVQIYLFVQYMHKNKKYMFLCPRIVEYWGVTWSQVKFVCLFNNDHGGWRMRQDGIDIKYMMLLCCSIRPRYDDNHLFYTALGLLSNFDFIKIKYNIAPTTDCL